MSVHRVYHLVLVILLCTSIAIGQLENLPACGQTCINNLLTNAASAGCNGADVACICGNANSVLGLRDCAAQSCNVSDYKAVVDFAIKYCAAAGVAVTFPPPPQVITSSSTTRPASSTTSPTTSASFSTTTSSSSIPSSSASSTLTSSTSLSSSSSTSSNTSQSPPPSSSSTSISSTNSDTPRPSPSDIIAPAQKATSELSTGAKAGIGIGAVVGAGIFGLLAYIAFLLRKRSKAHESTVTAGQNEASAGPNIPEMGHGLSHEVAAVERPGELSGHHHQGDAAKWDWGPGIQRSELKG